MVSASAVSLIGVFLLVKLASGQYDTSFSLPSGITLPLPISTTTTSLSIPTSTTIVISTTTTLALEPTSSTSSSSPPAYTPAVHKVLVGGSPLAVSYSPTTVAANPGDLVEFVWDDGFGIHTVTQSTLANPCQELRGGFDSGILHTTWADSSFILLIENDEPIVFFSNIAGQCQLGMLGGINVDATDLIGAIEGLLGQGRRGRRGTPKWKHPA